MINKFRKLIFWYSKEQSLILFPLILIQMGLWFVLSRITANLIHKREMNKIVLGFTSLYYNGNSRAVYELMMKYPEKYYCYWIARNIKSFKDVKKQGGNVVYVYFPFTGIDYILNTDAIVTNDSYLTFLFPKKYIKIQLWHGEGPKGIAPNYEDCDIWCVPSEFIKERHNRLWGAPLEKLRVCGSPRIDMLNNYLHQPRKKLFNELSIEDDKKIILYAPTFDVGLWPWGNQYKGFEKLCKFCKKNNVILVLRLHPLAKVKKARIKKILKRYDNVYWFDMSKEPDTMKLLAIADILITDWSSIYTDFFLTERPILYMEIDPDYYTKKRGKSQVPPEFRAGEISKNSNEFFRALHNISYMGNRYSDAQKRLFRIIYGSVDGKASERVAKVIHQVVNQNPKGKNL